MVVNNGCSKMQSSENSMGLCEPSCVVLSQKQRRSVFKRERRRRKRQAIAKSRASALDLQTGEAETETGDEDEQKAEEQREQFHQEWLERERIAQEEFRLKREQEEAAQKKKEEEERRIKEEWEVQQRKEKEEQEMKDKKKRELEESVQKMLDQAESQLESSGPWKNPDAPKDYGTEKDQANCPFFLKTGACRFGERCSRKHEHPSSSCTLMVRAMFMTFGMEQSRRDDYDADSSLEYSEEELNQQFLDFYEDVLPEFRNAGRVVQFKVSCNFEPHLRGNVYIQYETEEQCKEAFMMFNGRWYAGRQLQCEFCPVTRWKTAICGLFDRRKCPKGKNCNFLHVFRNPDSEFWEADRDLHMSPDRRGGRYSTSHRVDRDGMECGKSSDRSQWRRTSRRIHSHEQYSYKGRRSRSQERGSSTRRRRSRSRVRQNHSRERQSPSPKRQSPSRRRQNSRREAQSPSKERRSSSRERGNRNREKPIHSKSYEREETQSEKSVSNNKQYRRNRTRSHSKDTLEYSEDKPRKNTSKEKKKKSKKKLKRKRSKSSTSSTSAQSDEDSWVEKCLETQSTSQAPDEEAAAVLPNESSPDIQTPVEFCQPEETEIVPPHATKSDSIIQSS
ncbi:hypothetical protein DNTS_008577 [Danionella cerebrum]|uniref:Uncharacterized protein n=1 Tax=Danionella cerebrum TaxID=2873325 RepID=A0A553Q6A0_9TELE|nr:hypothetical protein DNTS_008577 [Danionella translucida]